MKTDLQGYHNSMKATHNIENNILIIIYIMIFFLDKYRCSEVLCHNTK